jgi:Flp pilus assembly protein CpaB
LVGDDLRDVSAPAQLVPDAALDRTAAVGQVLLAPVAAGETITSARLSGSGLLVGTAPDTVALPVRLADPAAAALLVPGDRVDLLATSASDAGSDGVRVVGRDLVVLHSPGVHSDEREVMATDDLLGGLVVVAATERESFAIIEGAAGGPLWASLRQAG